MSDIWLDRIDRLITAVAKIGVPAVIAMGVLFIWREAEQSRAVNETERTKALVAMTEKVVDMTETVIDEINTRGEEHKQFAVDHSVQIEALTTIVEQLRGQAKNPPAEPTSGGT